MSRSQRVPATLGCATLVVVSAPALAQEDATAWRGRVMVYGWLPWTTADVTAGDRDPGGDVSGSASDALEALEFAAFATGEVQFDRFGVITDLVCASPSDVAAALGPGAARVSADLEFALWTVAESWRANAATRVKPSRSDLGAGHTERRPIECGEKRC